MDSEPSVPAAPGHPRTANPLVHMVRAPFELRTWKETLFLLLNFPIGIATFTIVVTGLALGVGLSITIIGIPILIGLVYVLRAMGYVERARAHLLLDLDVPRPYRRDPPADRWWRVPLSRSTDPATWIEVAYHLLLLAVGTVTFTLTLTLWALGFGLIFAFAFTVLLPEPVHVVNSWVQIVLDAEPYRLVVGSRGNGWVIDTPADLAIASLVGLAFIFLTPWIVRGLATANRILVRGMLGGNAGGP